VRICSRFIWLPFNSITYKPCIVFIHMKLEDTKQDKRSFKTRWWKQETYFISRVYFGVVLKSKAEFKVSTPAVEVTEKGMSVVSNWKPEIAASTRCALESCWSGTSGLIFRESDFSCRGFNIATDITGCNPSYTLCICRQCLIQIYWQNDMEIVICMYNIKF
jgi:hypothetical protein